MNYVLDIIIPAYNSKKTIEKTLDSIVIQKTKYKFNVLIVNDKSDYSYKDIINKYKKKLKIDELILSENKGPGLARQEGINHTKSKYIMFIDSDDYLYSKTSIEELINAIELEKTDIVVSDFILERDNKEEIKKIEYSWLHGKIYRRDFLKENNITFNNTRKNEDNGFNKLIVLLHAKIYYLEKITYVYHENPNSITRKNNRLYRFTGLEGFIENMHWAYKEAKKRKINDSALKNHILSVMTAIYYYYNDLKDEYDVNKLVLWNKKIYEIYKENTYTEEEINCYLDINRDITEKKLTITYEDFINIMEKNND